MEAVSIRPLSRKTLPFFPVKPVLPDLSYPATHQQNLVLCACQVKTIKFYPSEISIQ